MEQLGEQLDAVHHAWTGTREERVGIHREHVRVRQREAHRIVPGAVQLILPVAVGVVVFHDQRHFWGGFAVAAAEDDPDRMLYAARNRLYVSANGGVFWRSLPFELPDIESVGWID